MRVDGEDAPLGWLEAAADRHESLFDAVGASFFEATTALAFERFANAGVDVAVVEVGLGGRFDATNVLVPLAAGVTNVSLEHTDILGHTIAEIAREKAGIAKPGVPFLTTATGEALAALQDAATSAGALFENVGTTVSLRGAPGALRVISPERDYGVVALGLPGDHQALNAALAVRLAEIAAPDLSVEAVAAGLRTTSRSRGGHG
jgi:folylpolyglutamate synthase/dihydrofolate synthase